MILAPSTASFLKSAPRTTLVRGADLSTGVLHEMHALRSSMVEVKDCVRPEEVKAEFIRRCQRSTVALMRSPAGEIVGMIGWQAEVGTWRGRSFALGKPQFGFIHPAFRGDWTYLRRILGYVALQQLRLGCLPVYAYANVFLPSYLKACAAFPAKVHTTMDEHREWEHSLLLHLAEKDDTGTWNRRTRLLEIAVRPLPAEGPRLSSSRHGEAVCRYQKLNPNWLDGYGLPILISVTPGSIARAVLRGACAGRHRKRRSSRKTTIGARGVAEKARLG